MKKINEFFLEENKHIVTFTIIMMAAAVVGKLIGIGSYFGVLAFIVCLTAKLNSTENVPKKQADAVYQKWIWFASEHILWRIRKPISDLSTSNSTIDTLYYDLHEVDSAAQTRLCERLKKKREVVDCFMNGKILEIHLLQ